MENECKKTGIRRKKAQCRTIQQQKANATETKILPLISRLELELREGKRIEPRADNRKYIEGAWQLKRKVAIWKNKKYWFTLLLCLFVFHIISPSLASPSIRLSLGLVFFFFLSFTNHVN